MNNFAKLGRLATLGTFALAATSAFSQTMSLDLTQVGHYVAASLHGTTTLGASLTTTAWATANHPTVTSGQLAYSVPIEANNPSAGTYILHGKSRIDFLKFTMGRAVLVRATAASSTVPAVKYYMAKVVLTGESGKFAGFNHGSGTLWWSTDVEGSRVDAIDGVVRTKFVGRVWVGP